MVKAMVLVGYFVSVPTAVLAPVLAVADRPAAATRPWAPTRHAATIRRAAAETYVRDRCSVVLLGDDGATSCADRAANHDHHPTRSLRLANR